MTHPDSAQASIAVDNVATVKMFYVETMASLGYRKLEETESTLRFGVSDSDTSVDVCLLEIHSRSLQTPLDCKHVRLLVFDESILGSFLERGLSQGGVDPTGKGIYSVHTDFSAASLDDIEGNRLEVIFQRKP